MAEWVRTSTKSRTFHVHVDGAVLPKSLELYAKEKYGFFNDDFDHRLVIDSETLPARQLTLKLRNRDLVRQICDDLSERASAGGPDESFAGMIQSEFVMTELTLHSEYTKYQPIPSPFLVQLRKIDPSLGETFKTHELHLEFPTEDSDARLITELARTGMNVSFGAREVTFTVSGNLDQIRRIQEGLLEYLKRARGFNRAKLITEATVFHSLHRMLPENTPAVIQSISSSAAQEFVPGFAPGLTPGIQAAARA